MGTTINLANQSSNLLQGNDSIVIIDNFESIRGGRSLSVAGYAGQVIKAGHVIVKTAGGVYKPLAVATEAGKSTIATVGTLVAGTGYTASQTYTNVPLNGGSGYGAMGTVATGAGGAVSSITVTKPGEAYTIGDVLTFENGYAGGTGSGASVQVATVADVAGAYGALGSDTYAGILVATILKDKPFAGIMVRGTVNENASPYPVASIKAAIKTQLPTIIFTNDKA